MLYRLQEASVTEKSFFFLVDPGGFFRKEAFEPVGVGLREKVEQIHEITVSGPRWR